MGNNIEFTKLVTALPVFTRAATWIIHDMLEIPAFEEALKAFEKRELDRLVARWIMFSDPYKAPEQIKPWAEHISNWFWDYMHNS